MKKQLLLLSLAFITLLASCKKSEDDPAPSSEDLSYGTAFRNSSGDTTVDRTEGRYRLAMLKSLDTYAKLPNSATAPTSLDETTLKNMFSNTGSPFANTVLNTSGLQLKDVTARSKSTAEADEVRTTIESYFTKIATASTSHAVVASNGVAGRLANATATSTSYYLVDAKGIEYAQIIAKSLIGALLVDNIANVLLSDNSIANAPNTDPVAGKKYTVLEHRWDEAYGLLTFKDKYAETATATANGGEAFLGSYVWEYNKEAYPKLHLAFLKGRRAIVDKDRVAARAQAQYIRRELERTIAMAAVGYLGKYKSGANLAVKAHAIGEGAGFIYSLRFCTLNGADAQFSQDILDNLIYNAPNGFWDLTDEKADAAILAIKTKFGL